MDEVKTQLNKYFVYLAENHTTSHVFVDVPCEYLGEDKDEDTLKMIYYPQIICDGNNIEFMFRSIVKNNMFVSTVTIQIVSRDLMSFYGF